MCKISEDNEINFDSLQWLTAKEVAKYLRRSLPSIYTMVNRGQIKPRKFCRRLYFKKEELDRLIEDSRYLPR